MGVFLALSVVGNIILERVFVKKVRRLCVCVALMGLLFSSGGVVYKPAKDVDLSPTSSEFYLKAHVKGSLLFIFPSLSLSSPSSEFDFEFSSEFFFFLPLICFLRAFGWWFQNSSCILCCFQCLWTCVWWNSFGNWISVKWVYNME